MSRLKDLYKNEIMDAMTKKFGYKNVMEVPKLEKIVVNMGVGEAKENAKLLDAAIAATFPGFPSSRITSPSFSGPASSKYPS